MPWAELLPSGNYRASYRDRSGKVKSAGTFPPAPGKRPERTAEAAAAVKEDEVHKPGWRDPSAGLITWGAWYEQWWPKRTIEPSTAKSELGVINKHILPKWKDTPLIEITRLDVKEWGNYLSKRSGLSAASAIRYMTIFASSMAAAFDKELIPSNPAYKVKMMPADPPSHVFLTKAQYAAIRRHIPEAADKALVDFLVGTGLRWGEAAGLHLDHLDLVRGEVHVAEVFAEGEIKPYPKGRRDRHVEVLDWVVGDLVLPDIHGRCGVTHRRGICRSPLVFPTPDGGVRDDRNFFTRVWEPAMKAAGLKHLGATLHDLRHTYASWLIQAGIPIEEISARLGHGSVNTTMVYAHLGPLSRKRLKAALADPRGANVEQATPSRDYGTLHAIR